MYLLFAKNSKYPKYTLIHYILPCLQDQRHGGPGGLRTRAAPRLPRHRRGLHRILRRRASQLRECQEGLVGGEGKIHEESKGEIHGHVSFLAAKAAQ